jgi:hypothetical protein
MWQKGNKFSISLMNVKYLHRKLSKVIENMRFFGIVVLWLEGKKKKIK